MYITNRNKNLEKPAEKYVALNKLLSKLIISCVHTLPLCLLDCSSFPVEWGKNGNDATQQQHNGRNTWLSLYSQMCNGWNGERGEQSGDF